jgi:hypothetical protein
VSKELYSERVPTADKQAVSRASRPLFPLREEEVVLDADEEAACSARQSSPRSPEGAL